MTKKLEQRLSRLEQCVAERTEGPQACNCRVVTRFHSGKCLNAILTGISRVCPLHGFRDLGFLFWTSIQYPLQSEENQFCPCPPDPWRSFVMSEGPHTWEGHNAAKEACNKIAPDDHFNFQEYKREIEAAVAKYSEERRQSVEAGRELPNKEKFVKLQEKRAGNHGDQESSAWGGFLSCAIVRGYEPRCTSA